MIGTYYPGETMRLMARDLEHVDEGIVTADATVTVTVLNPDGTTYAEETAQTDGIGNDWYVDLAAPATVGVYAVQIVATKGAATAKDRNAIRVKAF